MNNQQKLVTVNIFILFGFASLLFIAGILGLMMPEFVPALANPKVAWALIGVGCVLDLIGGWQLLSNMKEAKK